MNVSDKGSMTYQPNDMKKELLECFSNEHMNTTRILNKGALDGEFININL